MPTEEEIIAGCIRSDRKSQKALYDLFASKMLAISMRYCKGQLEAEDVLQEAFIKVFDHIKNFRGESKLYTWIKRIVINTALNHQRSKLYLYPMVDVDTLKHKEDREVLLSSFSYQDLLKMIQNLPSGCQVIFNLYAVEGYQHNEIAEMLSISEGTSKSQYARAKYLLKNMLSEQEGERYEKFR
jgi:RNA polymerase sigma-70 factor (ECF subfamily)